MLRTAPASRRPRSSLALAPLAHAAEGARGLDRPAGGDHLDRSALPQPLAQQHPAAAHLRAAGQARREPEAGARPRDLVEGDRRPHVGVQAAQEREASTTARPSPPTTWSFTLKRVPNVPNSPSSFATFTKPIVDVKVVDPHTHRLQDRRAARAAAERHGRRSTSSRRLHGEKAATADYNSGKAAIGTGPYKFAEYIPNQRVVLKANYGYWGGEEPWDKVTFKILTNSAARVAALLSGDVQMIETVPTSDIAKLVAGQEVRARRQGLQPRDLRAPEPVERQDRRRS